MIFHVVHCSANLETILNLQSLLLAKHGYVNSNMDQIPLGADNFVKNQLIFNFLKSLIKMAKRMRQKDFSRLFNERTNELFDLKIYILLIHEY